MLELVSLLASHFVLLLPPRNLVKMKHPGMPHDKGGGTYASKASKTIPTTVYEDRNVIIVRIRKNNDQAKVNFSDSICELVLQKLNINVESDTIGAQ